MSAQLEVHRILVLDDDKVMRDLLEAVLSMAGYDTTLASSGAEALVVIENHPRFDAVLSDLRMPGLEGGPLAHSLREALSPEVPLVGMSSSTPSSEVLSLFDAFISKPFEAEGLRRTFQEAQTKRLSTAEEEMPAKQDLPNPSRDASEVVVLDENVFRSLAKVIPLDQLAPLYEMTLNDIARRHARILEAADLGDLDTVRHEAHAIKGSCGMVGATELHRIAAKVEAATTLDAAREAQFPAATQRLRGMLSAKLHT